MSMSSTQMIRKRPRGVKRSTTGSSSYDGTAPSKPPKDILALGRHLVRELNLEDGVDTLGRWTAHYLAELLAEVERSRSRSDRRAAQKRVMAVILQTWERRRELPGRAYPLVKYREAAIALGRIRTQLRPFEPSLSAAGPLGVTHAIFTAASRLMLYALLDTLPAKQIDTDRAVTAMLDAEEKEYLKAMKALYQVFDQPKKRSAKTRRTKADEPIDPSAVRASRLDVLQDLVQNATKLRDILGT
jgi:hypothetical protein